jgi:hypothetical protein
VATAMPAACARYPRTAWPSPGRRAEQTVACLRSPSGIGTSAGMEKKRGIRLCWRHVCVGLRLVVGTRSRRAAATSGLCRRRPGPKGWRCDSGRSGDPSEIRTGCTANPGSVRPARGYLHESGARCIWGISSMVPSADFVPHRRATWIVMPHWSSRIRRPDAQPPSVSRTSLRLLWRHVKIGVSRSVYRLPSVSRRAITRSRKSSGLSDSNATTHS